MMMWQMWTAFGAMLGLLTGVASLHIGDGADTASCSEELGNLLACNCVSTVPVFAPSAEVSPATRKLLSYIRKICQNRIEISTVRFYLLIDR